jgi:hypothetical protein
MTKRITFVIDAADTEWADHYRRTWHPETLAEELAKAGKLETAVFTGKLEDAPDSSAYILYTDNEKLAARAAGSTVVKDRLAKSIAAESNIMRAPRLANEHKLLGSMDIVASALSEAENYLVVKSAIGQRLRWDLSEIETSGEYARTNHTNLTLPKLLVAYLDAALR